MKTAFGLPASRRFLVLLHRADGGAVMLPKSYADRARAVREAEGTVARDAGSYAPQLAGAHVWDMDLIETAPGVAPCRRAHDVSPVSCEPGEGGPLVTVRSSGEFVAFARDEAGDFREQARWTDEDPGPDFEAAPVFEKEATPEQATELLGRLHAMTDQNALREAGERYLAEQADQAAPEAEPVAEDSPPRLPGDLQAAVDAFNAVPTADGGPRVSVFTVS